MAVSTGHFTMNIGDVIDEAMDIVGGDVVTGYEPQQARRSLNLLLTDWQNRDILLWTTDMAQVSTVSATAAVTMATSTIDALNVAVRRTSIDSELQRISIEEYWKIPDKTTTGKPAQYAIHRLRDAAVMYLYPAPENATDVLRIWRFKKFNAFDASRADPDVPSRFYPALVYGLAHYMSHKRPNQDPQRKLEIREEYERLLDQALDEDRDRAPLKVLPKVGWR